jgi:hypothetical protein
MKYIKSKKRLILLIILAVFVVAAASFAYYVSDYYHADSTAALKSTESYNITDADGSITFTPTQNKSSTGIIFYPGGKVQAEAYPGIASKLAAKGYTTIIVKMPFN